MLLYFKRQTQSIFWFSLASGLTLSYEIPSLFKTTGVYYNSFLEQIGVFTGNDPTSRTVLPKL